MNTFTIPITSIFDKTDERKAFAIRCTAEAKEADHTDAVLEVEDALRRSDANLVHRARNALNARVLPTG